MRVIMVTHIVIWLIALIDDNYHLMDDKNNNDSNNNSNTNTWKSEGGIITTRACRRQKYEEGARRCIHYFKTICNEISSTDSLFAAKKQIAELQQGIFLSFKS